MTTFSLVMLGKFFFSCCFYLFFAAVAALRLNPAASLFLIKTKYKIKSSRLYALIVHSLLLEHLHEVVSTSFDYFVKLVLDVRRPNLFHFGGKKGRTRRATQA